MKNLSNREKMAIYVQGYGPNCGFTLKEWFEIQTYFRNNPEAAEEVKKTVAATNGGNKDA